MPVADDRYVPLAEDAGGWRRQDPAGLGIDVERLGRAVAFHDTHRRATVNNGGALVVVHRGFLVAESYVTGVAAGPRPWTPQTCNDVKSATKSIFGTAVGVFLDEFGSRVGLDRLLVGTSREESLIPQIWDQPITDPRKTEIEVRHVLSMTSGHSTAEPWLAPTPRHHFPTHTGAHQMYEYCFGWWHFENVPDQHRLLFQPGTAFNYSNYGLELLALAMRNLSGEETGPYLFDRVLGQMGLPVGVRDNSYHQMPYTDANEWNFGDEPGWGRGGGLGCNAYGADGGDSPYGYNSIVGSTFRCSARDFARLGHLWLNKGSWGDAQLVPSEWLELATQRYRRDDGTRPENYGFTFWVNDEWEGVPRDTFSARGHNLNECYVIPSLDLVVARQGNSNPDRETSEEFSRDLIRGIVESLPGS